MTATTTPTPSPTPTLTAIAERQQRFLCVGLESALALALALPFAFTFTFTFACCEFDMHNIYLDGSQRRSRSRMEASATWRLGDSRLSSLLAVRTHPT